MPAPTPTALTTKRGKMPETPGHTSRPADPATPAKEQETGDFWSHLDVLRGTIIRSLVAVTVLSVAAFAAKGPLFDALLAPSHPDFVIYRLFDRLSALAGGYAEPFALTLINTQLASQLMVHLQAAACVGLIVAAPYILYELFRFVAPGLYPAELRLARRALTGGFLLFAAGVALTYFLIFPLTLRFLATYQVDPSIGNYITLSSYMSTLLTLSLGMGLCFELPLVLWILGRLGVVDRPMLARMRRHAVVAILIVVAVITPTTDVLTLIVVFLPVYMLYELSLLTVPRRR